MGMGPSRPLPHRWVRWVYRISRARRSRFSKPAALTAQVSAAGMGSTVIIHVNGRMASKLICDQAPTMAIGAVLLLGSTRFHLQDVHPTLDLSLDIDV
jgi:hypothetical protein